MSMRVLFICHGNICRSPMGEYILKKMVRDLNIADRFHIESAATSAEELGNPVYPPAKRKLAQQEIFCDGHRARRIEKRDYDKFDYILAAESFNIRNMMRILGSDPENKIYRVMDFTDHPCDIDDPWYTGDFDGVYDQIVEGCKAFLEHVHYGK